MSGQSACEKSPKLITRYDVGTIVPDIDFGDYERKSSIKLSSKNLYVITTVSLRQHSDSAKVQISLKYKDLFDKIAATIMLLLASPLMLATYLLIKVLSPGNAIFKQERLTLNGRIFTLYKFRSMHLDAEKESGAVMAGENDPRIFPLGRFLRKTRIDELPQLINVLKGEMSIVGPRPERPEIAKKLERELHGFSRRMKTKAGLTGLAQVKQGYCSSVDSYKRKVALDLLYIRKQSLLLDLWILLNTVSVIIFLRGSR